MVLVRVTPELRGHVFDRVIVIFIRQAHLLSLGACMLIPDPRTGHGQWNTTSD